jgi:acyl-coenzyme A synthetase/AMP-(fatty) acid ligase/thioesterase domain-containing protein/acyl carrier protein
LLSLAEDVCPNETTIILLDEANYHGQLVRKVKLSPHSNAVIMYTSGSTGEPKGTLRSHQLILHQAWVTQNLLNARPDTRMLGLRPYSTTASLNELFTPLLNGWRIVPIDFRQDGLEGLSTTLRNRKITIMRPPIQAMRFFLDSLPDEVVFPDLQYVYATGDVLYRTDVEKLRRIIPADSAIIHTLSMSEVGLLTLVKITKQTFLNSDIVPTGYPVDGKEILVLDENGNEPPVGEVGEIFVRTDFEFPGYWQDKERTLSRFVPDPANEKRSIFATGDLGQIRPDGQLVHMGRRDWRVKIRGFSVNLSAIEHVLKSDPDVQRAVVVAVEDPSAQKRLVAYIMPIIGAEPKSSTLIDLVSANLPDYMVPSLFIYLPELPVGITGKIDRKALPSPNWQFADEESSFTAPRDDIEKKLVGVWKKTLKIQAIGIESDFFRLGGDSLLAIQLLFEIERTFSKKMPLSIISQASTIKEQAELLRDEKLLGAPSIIVPIRAEGAKEPIFCLAGAGGNAFRFHPILKYLPEDRPVYFVRSRGLEAGEVIYTTVEDIALDFLNEIKKVQPRGPYYFIGSSGGGRTGYEVAQQLLSQGESVDLLVMLDTYLDKKKDSDALKIKRGGDSDLSNLDKKKIRVIKIKKKWKKRLRRQKERIGRNGWKYFLDFLYQFLATKAQAFVRNFRKDNIFRLQKKVEEANYAAARAYQVKPYAGRVIYFRADRKAIRQGREPDVRWEKAGIDKLIIYPLNCGHFDLLLEPFVQEVAEKINRYLE